jgi:enamine deaminase RidA (YjgF/YER057c/UK114 family)
MPTPEQRLDELGLVLPAPFSPAADYIACRRLGQALYISGHGPMRDGKAVFTGKVGAELDLSAGRQSAELTMLNVLASLKAELGELSRVGGFVRLSVFVNATADFAQHHLVADGASGLLGKVFGADAAQSRSAVGMFSLPFGIATEIEAVAEVE